MTDDAEVTAFDSSSSAVASFLRLESKFLNLDPAFDKTDAAADLIVEAVDEEEDACCPRMVAVTSVLVGEFEFELEEERRVNNFASAIQPRTLQESKLTARSKH